MLITVSEVFPSHRIKIPETLKRTFSIRFARSKLMSEPEGKKKKVQVKIHFINWVPLPVRHHGGLLANQKRQDYPEQDTDPIGSVASTDKAASTNAVIARENDEKFLSLQFFFFFCCAVRLGGKKRPQTDKYHPSPSSYSTLPPHFVSLLILSSEKRSSPLFTFHFPFCLLHRQKHRFYLERLLYTDAVFVGRHLLIEIP